MRSSAELIELQLGLLQDDLRGSAVKLGEEFPKTYRLGTGWNWRSTTAGLKVPTDITQRELLKYFSVVYNATCLRDHFICRYCDFDGLRTASSYAAIQVDHIQPRSAEAFRNTEDGLIRCFSPENLATACCGCNKIKMTKGKRNRESQVVLEMTRDEKIDAVRRELFVDRDEHIKVREFISRVQGTLPSRPILD